MDVTVLDEFRAFIDRAQVMLGEIQVLQATVAEVPAEELVPWPIITKVVIDFADRLKRAAISLDSAVVGRGAKVVAPTRHQRLVASARLLIEQRRHVPNLSVANVSASLGVSRSHLSRVLQAETGTTFRSTVVAVRLDRARRLLLETTLSMKEIARDVGFRSISELDRQFRREMGITPTGFREAGAWRTNGMPVEFCGGTAGRRYR
jgi:AraC-like DNA-binding protein